MSTGETTTGGAGSGVTFEEMAPTGRDSAPVIGEKSASDLEAVFDVPVRISVVLGRTRVPVSQLLKMDVGTVVELDRQVGEAVEIYVNDRLVARGEIVLVENRLGVTMTEIIKAA
jgi:flagellar motor switch protein FliN/FliY